MRMISSIIFIFTVICSHSLSPILLNAAEIQSRISLKAVSIPVSIQYPERPGGGRWAAYALEATGKFLPLAEQYLDTPFTGTRGFKIIVCDKCGSMDSGTVKIGHSDKNSPALLFHELGHFWYGYAPGYTKIEWLVEGIVSFLPMAMHEKGILAMTGEERGDLINGWMFRTVIPEKEDRPLSVFDKDYYYRYAKSYKIQYLIYSELGRDKYRSFLRSILTEHPSDNTAVISLLNRYKPMAWQRFLAGWVFPGDYQAIGMEDFKDHDNDGLMSVEEHYLGTAGNRSDSDGDGYGDGWEKEHEYNPLDAKSPSGITFPVVDGSPDRISRTPGARIDDAKGDNNGSSDISRGEAYILDGGGHDLFFRGEFHVKEVKPSFHTVHIQTADGRNFWIQTKNPVTNLWISEFRDGTPFDKWTKSSIDPDKIKMAYAEVFELSLSLKDLNIRAPFKLRYYSGGYNNTLEKWDSDSTDFITILPGTR